MATNWIDLLENIRDLPGWLWRNRKSRFHQIILIWTVLAFVTMAYVVCSILLYGGI